MLPKSTRSSLRSPKQVCLLHERLFIQLRYSETTIESTGYVSALEIHRLVSVAVNATPFVGAMWFVTMKVLPGHDLRKSLLQQAAAMDIKVCAGK